MEAKTIETDDDQDVMMFYGSSDDLFEMFSPDHGWIEFCDPSLGEFVIRLDHDEYGSMKVVSSYVGEWSMGIAPVEGEPFLADHCEITFDLADNGYSSLLHIFVPSGTTWDGV